MKILITTATFAPSLDGPTYLPAGSFVELETDSARAVVIAAKGLYVDGKDDPTRRGQQPGQWTATEAQVTSARDALKAAEKSAKVAA